MKKQKDEVMEDGETEKCKKYIRLKFHPRIFFYFCCFILVTKSTLSCQCETKLQCTSQLHYALDLGSWGQSYMD
jgi:hypothetical protein